MIATALFGIERNGKKRWLGVGGASIQPTEFVKIALIVMLASMIVQMGKNINEKRGVTVSYTHLDVYKRQRLRSAGRAAWTDESGTDPDDRLLVHRSFRNGDQGRIKAQEFHIL